MPASRRWRAPARLPRALLSLLPLFLGACAETEARPHRPGSACLDRLVCRPPDPWAIAAAVAPSLPPPDERYVDLADAVAADPVRVLASVPDATVLDQLESVFFATGRILDLVDFYAAAVADQGATSAIRPRLAWIYARVGLHSRAVTEARGVTVARPDDPAGWFVLGYALAMGEGGAPAHTPEILAALERCLALDPDFVAPGGIRADEIRAQLAELGEARPGEEPHGSPGE